MILGTGIDLVETERFQYWLENPELLERYFNPEEIRYIHSKGQERVPSLAVRYAAKEAFGKALGTGLRGMALKDIEVVVTEGSPRLALYGRAREIFEKRGGKEVFLSLSHEKSFSLAQVIITGKEL